MPHECHFIFTNFYAKAQKDEHFSHHPSFSKVECFSHYSSRSPQLAILFAPSIPRLILHIWPLLILFLHSAHLPFLSDTAANPISPLQQATQRALAAEHLSSLAKQSYLDEVLPQHNSLTFPDYPQGASHFSNLERSTFVMSHQFTTPEIPSILSSYHVNLLRELTFKGCLDHSPFLEAQRQPQCCQSHPDSSHSQFSHSSSYSNVHINRKPVSISPFITGPVKTGLSLRSGQHNAVMHWALETRKLRSNNTITVSPPFDLNLTTNSSRVRFKIFILSNDRTKRIDLKRGQPQAHNLRPYPVFWHQNGQSRNTLRAGRHTLRVGRLCSIELKCEEELPPEIAISSMIKVGSGNLSETRGPVEHNFFSNAIGRLPKSAQFWDLSRFQDDNSQILDIFIELQVLSCHGKSSLGATGTMPPRWPCQ